MVGILKVYFVFCLVSANSEDTDEILHSVIAYLAFHSLSMFQPT